MKKKKRDKGEIENIITHMHEIDINTEGSK